MYDLFDVFQQGMITNTQALAKSAQQDAAAASDRVHFEIQRLEAKIDGLALICEALWEMLKERSELTDEDIHNRIAEIDLRDGRRDGRISGRTVKCSKCERPGHTRLASCMYCGAPYNEP